MEFYKDFIKSKEMKQKKLEGIVVAMPTPLLENEDIDIPSLLGLLDYCIEEGVNGIMLAGTMGEGTNLISSQLQCLIEKSVEHVNGRVPVLATVSASSTRKTIENSKLMEKSGIDFLVCTAPFYYKYPAPESIITHIKKIADSVNYPVVFYNLPGATGNVLDLNTIDKILNLEEVVGIKDSGGNLPDFLELLRRYPDKENRPGTLMPGIESSFDCCLLMGADGVVTGGGVLYIKLLSDLYKACLENNKSLAMKLQVDFFSQLSSLLGPNKGRDWVYKIKNKLVELNVIKKGFVTTPFYSEME